ncbi:Subtilisin-like protease 6, partial [Dissostichus eleginoides]
TELFFGHCSSSLPSLCPAAAARNPVGKDSFHFYAQLFLLRLPRRGVFPRLLWISNPRLLGVSSGQTARCHPGLGSPVRGLLVVIFAQEGHAQPERRRK